MNMILYQYYIIKNVVNLWNSTVISVTLTFVFKFWSTVDVDSHWVLSHSFYLLFPTTLYVLIVSPSFLLRQRRTECRSEEWTFHRSPLSGKGEHKVEELTLSHVSFYVLINQRFWVWVSQTYYIDLYKDDVDVVPDTDKRILVLRKRPDTCNRSCVNGRYGRCYIWTLPGDPKFVTTYRSTFSFQ